MTDIQTLSTLDGERAPVAPSDAETISDLLRHWAREQPNAPALADPPDKAELGLGPAFAVTYGQADAIADRLAHNFDRAGLNPGDIIALQLPNTVECLLTMLGAWRAGLTVAPLSPLWRLSEVDRAFSQICPRAFVTIARFAGHAHGETVCQAAVDHLSIRFAFGFGPELPDAITAIDDWLDPAPIQPFPQVPDGPPDEPRAAVVTWTANAFGPCEVPRSEAELLALARVFASELRLTARDVLLDPFAPTTATAFGGLIVPSLLSGARLLLHEAFTLDVFLDQLLHDKVTYTAVPAAALATLEESGYLPTHARRLARLGCVWQAPATAVRSVTSELPIPIFDIHNLAEKAMIVRPRELGDDPRELPLGPVRLLQFNEAESPYIETRLVDSEGNDAAIGEVLVRGQTVPTFDVAPAGAERLDYVPTGIEGALAPGDRPRFVCERSTDLIQHGGIVMAASELDRLYAAHPDFLDAAAFTIDDPVLGERVIAAVVPRADASLSLDALRRYLTEQHVAPYKLPDRLIAVSGIPRDSGGKVAREDILRHIAA